MSFQHTLTRTTFVLLITAFIFLLPGSERLDTLVNDFVTRTIAQKSQPDTDIVIVDIDDASLERLAPQLGHWPWPRSAHALLVEALHAADAHAVIFDILLSEPDIYRPDSDAHLAETLNKTAPNFLAALLLPASAPISPTRANRIPEKLILKRPGAQQHVKVLLPIIGDLEHNPPGLINFTGDSDGVLRRYVAGIDSGSVTLISLPAQVIRHLIPKQKIPATWYLKYKGKTVTPYHTAPYHRVFSKVVSGQPLTEFKGKWVIIGSSASGLHDLRASPLATMHPAVHLLATAIDNLKNGEKLVAVPPWFTALLAILLSLGVWLIGGHAKTFIAQLKQQALILMIISLLSALAIWLAITHDTLPNIGRFLSAMILNQAGLLAYSGIKEYRRARHITEIFQRFLDPRVVRQLVQQGQTQHLMHTRACEITILFSDIRGFTTLSEQLPADEVVNLLNRYFSLQTEVIFRYGGTLDKFIGDAVMAFWGAPIDDPNHAQNAFQCAQEMIQTLEAFKQTLPPTLRGFDIGIGLHTGPAVVGLIGSDRRLDYTAIGDTVNLASRIEGLTKTLGRVLVSRDVYNKLHNHSCLAYVGEHKVKGRRQPVKLYTLVSHKSLEKS